MKEKLTNDIDKINYEINDKIADLGIGKLFYDKESIEIESSELYRGDDYIYDTERCNFHFLPKITDGNKELWYQYLEQVTTIRNKIIKELQGKVESFLKDDTGKYIKLGFPTGDGSRGNVISVKNYKPNCFFKYLKVGSKETGYYTINFIRWFIDKDKNVNCRMGEIQFDYTNNHCVNEIYTNKSHNEVHVINYPTSYKGQNLKKITINKKTSSCIYNPPGLGNIWNLDEGKVVESFEEFINYVYHLRKEQ